jgi:hypothetical protein
LITRRILTAAIVLAAYVISTISASAMTIKEFRKFTIPEQGMYIGAAVSMLAYTYAAIGDVAKARCVQSWYYGKRGVETPGPSQVTIEIDLAGNVDAEKYQVEGVILGVADKACGAGASQGKQKP